MHEMTPEPKPITAETDIIRKLREGWVIFPYPVPFYRGGAVYEHGLVNPHKPGAAQYILSHYTMKNLSLYLDYNGQVALLREGESYRVIGKSGSPAGSINKFGRQWVVQLHGSPPESWSSLRLAKTNALAQALHY